jgi:hypothetical protein
MSTGQANRASVLTNASSVREDVVQAHGIPPFLRA